MTKIIVVAPQRRAERLAKLQQQYPSVQFVSPEDRADVASQIDDADAVFGTLTGDEFEAARKLRWIQSPSAGVEWMHNVAGLAESNVVVTNMRGAHAVTIAEHAFAMLLTLTRAMRQFEEHQQRQEWARGQLNDRLVGIKGLTMGIVGFGNIGRAIARRGHGFEMRLLAVDAQSVPPAEGVAEVWPLSRLNDMCRQSNVLAIAAPITPETRGMVGREQIGLLPDGSYLLAMSRGGIVDELALIDALQSGHLAGAGLDVTATEPLPASDPLWRAPNVIITPHNSPTSRLTTDLVWSIFSENIGHFLKGEPLTNVVDKHLGY
ncbi:MAG: D-2-hydroxyacid dehydrogenase [Chloroflexi bacterium]|nr:D-2-hydroxyacid dehydrogenase [Chloroflexota bacterium]